MTPQEHREFVKSLYPNYIHYGDWVYKMPHYGWTGGLAVRFRMSGFHKFTRHYKPYRQVHQCTRSPFRRKEHESDISSREEGVHVRPKRASMSTNCDWYDQNWHRIGRSWKRNRRNQYRT